MLLESLSAPRNNRCMFNLAEITGHHRVCYTALQQSCEMFLVSYYIWVMTARAFTQKECVIGEDLGHIHFTTKERSLTDKSLLSWILRWRCATMGERYRFDSMRLSSVCCSTDVLRIRLDGVGRALVKRYSRVIIAKTTPYFSNAAFIS